MRPNALALRRSFWMVCACVLLLPRLSAATPPTSVIDFDGDGYHDRVTLDRREPSVLHVWLSESDTTQLIRSRVPLVQVIVTDLDGDHRPELIARDSESNIHVWTRKRKGFRSVRPRRIVPGTLQRPNHRRIEDEEKDSSGVITITAFEPFALTLCASPRAPGIESFATCAPHTARVYLSRTAFDPFTPRPPPPNIPL